MHSAPCLKPHQGFSIVEDADALAAALPLPPVSQDLHNMLEADALGPMSKTLEQLIPLFKRTGILP